MPQPAPELSVSMPLVAEPAKTFGLSDFSRTQARIFAITWIAYAGYYLCRKNLSVIMPLLERDLGFTALDLANVVLGFSAAYSAGQFLIGRLADRYGPRAVVTTGMLGAALATAACGLVRDVWWLMALQVVNGFCQACGFSGIIKILARWFDPRVRGVVMGFWGTSYGLGASAATLIATWAATGPLWAALGWRRACYIPAALLCLVALLFWTTVKTGRAQPTRNPLPDAAERDSSFSFFAHPPLIAVAGMYFCVKLMRYSLLFWLPMYMTNRLGYSPADAGYSSSSFELIGFGGMIAAGYVSDRLVNGRRFPVAAVMLVLLAIAFALFPGISSRGFWWNVSGVAILGVLLMGPDSLMSGAAVQDLAPEHAVARVAGIVNGFGSLGQVASPYVVAWVVRWAGWDQLFGGFIFVAALGAAAAATQWKLPPPLSHRTVVAQERTQ